MPDRAKEQTWSDITYGLVLGWGNLCICLIPTGFLVSRLWNWFVVPLGKFGTIDAFQAAGIWLVCRLLFLNRVSNRQEDDGPFNAEAEIKDSARRLFGSFLGVAMTYAVAAFIHGQIK